MNFPRPKSTKEFREFGWGYVEGTAENPDVSFVFMDYTFAFPFSAPSG